MDLVVTRFINGNFTTVGRLVAWSDAPARAAFRLAKDYHTIYKKPLARVEKCIFYSFVTATKSLSTSAALRPRNLGHILRDL